jgi:hypothetical protein
MKRYHLSICLQFSALFTIVRLDPGVSDFVNIELNFEEKVEKLAILTKTDICAMIIVLLISK